MGGAFAKCKRPEDFTLERWEAFIRDRTAGVYGQAVSLRTVEADLIWLRGVLGWAVKWGLIRRNPVAGYPIPKELNPSQPVMTQEQYEAILEVAHEVHPYLPALLTIAHESGRRLSAICGLRWEDIQPGRVAVWRRDLDKAGVERAVPFSAAFQSALESQSSARAEGSAYVFPGPRASDDKPLHRSVADKWGRQAAARAGVEWTGWHSIRRKWASERPLTQATAFAGGWKDVVTLAKIYNKPSMEDMRDVVENSDA